jgi:hypothetical protein
MVICDQASQDNDASPKQERKRGDTLNRSQVDEIFFPQLLVFVERDLENDCHHRADSDEKHFRPKRKGYQLMAIYSLARHWATTKGGIARSFRMEEMSAHTMALYSHSPRRSTPRADLQLTLLMELTTWPESGARGPC